MDTAVMVRPGGDEHWPTFFEIAGGHVGGRFKLLDVRSRSEWRTNHLVGSDVLNVPLAELESVKAIVPRGSSLLVFGRDREETERAVRLLRTWRYEVLAAPGGYRDLVRQGQLETEGSS
jgi:rhodanese-related sulfurtransferase